MHSPSIRFSAIEIPVASLERATRWYQQALGYSCTWSDQHHAMLANHNDAAAARIFLVQTDDATRLAFQSTHTGVQHSVLDFETDDLEGVHAHLSGLMADLGSIPEPANAWAPRGFGFRDSEGNHLAVFSFVKSP